MFVLNSGYQTRSPYASSPKQPIPGLQHQPLCSVLAELADLIFLEHEEGFAGVIVGHQIRRLEEGAQPAYGEDAEVVTNRIIPAAIH